MHEMKLEDNSQCLLLQYDFLEESKSCAKSNCNIPFSYLPKNN